MLLGAIGLVQSVNVVCTACRKQREASRDDVSEALAMTEDELKFMPQAGATTSANTALTAAAMASARHRRQGHIMVLPMRRPAKYLMECWLAPISRREPRTGQSIAAATFWPIPPQYISGYVDLRRLITIPEWLAAPSKYQRYWVRYTVASVAGLWTLRFLYMCGGPFYVKLTHAKRSYIWGQSFPWRGWMLCVFCPIVSERL